VKAVRTHGRGGPEQIFFEDAPLPEVRPGDVLVQVRATGITPAELTWDETYQNAGGAPRIPSIPGHEVSGVVERMAADVTDFRIGDEVYGLADFPRDGAAAEFAAVRAPWKCRRLVIGTGTGALPVMEEVKREADRRKIKLFILPTVEAIEELKQRPDETNAVLHVTC
jgi:NADPH:quinone reductase-like Zn-dependent oxidoreductase